MSHVPTLFGCNVFGDAAMREHLSPEIYQSLKRTAQQGRTLDPAIAMAVAEGMKNWAVQRGATHFTHWFQPMTGVTAEKHDSFVTPAADGKIMMEFSGKELTKGEPDASSFPSGGLRCTFEARGYTAWDPSSYAFLKDGTLCIPTAFFSYSGEALDKKTPLLRSMQAINRQAKRILRLFGNETSQRVIPTVGAEQEYFLIDKELFLKRRDLIYTGRTLLGAKPPKGQELDDHYFGRIKPRISAFMKELDEELWKLSILSKSKHNEAAPSQHEFAPIFATTNIAADQNSLAMEIMHKTADRHGLSCLLHEKPFSGVNGSGKHNNWSLSTDDGINLLDPGDSPEENAQFLLFLCAVIAAADEFADLLRLSVASAGNDHRLGANEAPPAIISMYLGEQLTEVLEALESGRHMDHISLCTMDIGVKCLPKLPKDTTDRNRTSPFAFTGNRFEFRMPGSSASVADPNIMLNTAVAEILRRFADRLEQAEDFNKAVGMLVRETYGDHKRIIFNGNNYSAEWREEAARRGLPNLRTTVDAIPPLLSPENMDVLTFHGVMSPTEIRARYEIMLEAYCKTLNIEALTMLEITRQDIIPAVLRYTEQTGRSAAAKAAALTGSRCALEHKILEQLDTLGEQLFSRLAHLESIHEGAPGHCGALENALYYRDRVIPAMNALRETADALEKIVSKACWGLPSYGDLLFLV